MIKVSQADLLPRKLFIATPMYGASCDGAFAHSLLQVREVMERNRLTARFVPVFNDSYISRARNTLVDEFMRTDCTHMLFWDADIGASPDDVLSLLTMADPATVRDVVCGLYPKKHIRWDKIVAAVKQGIAADDLENFVGDCVFNPVGLSGSHDLYEPLEVAECGTGFMMIQRSVFERFQKAYPDHWYASVREGEPGRNWAYFDSHIDRVSRRFLTEDYNFCRLIRGIGCKVFVCPWLNLSHFGRFEFVGNPGAVSSIERQAAA